MPHLARRGTLAPTLRDFADAGWGLLTTSLGLAVAIGAVDGATATGPLPIIVVALTVALADFVLRPLLRLLALAVGAIGAMLCGLVAQVLIAWAALGVVPGVGVANWSSALAVIVVASLVMALGRWLIGANDSAYVLGDTLRRARAHARNRARRGETALPGEAGLLVVQLDGLSSTALRHAIEAGLAPTMTRWLSEGSHRLVSWWSPVPSTTPAVQAGILHGNSGPIPAFRWWDKELGRLVVSNRPQDSALVESRVSDGNGLLAHGGAAISTMFSGDAPTAPAGHERDRQRRRPGPGAELPALLRQPLRPLPRAQPQHRRDGQGALPGPAPAGPPGGAARPPARLVRPAARHHQRPAARPQRLARRRAPPARHARHLRQPPRLRRDRPPRRPEPPESLRALEGLDGVLALLEQVARAAPRHYRIVVLSDHGQSLGPTFRQVEGTDLAGVCRGLLSVPDSESVEASEGEAWGPVNTLLTALFRTRPSRRPVVVGPDRHREEEAAAAGGELPELAVVASGNLGLVWFPRIPGRLTLEEMLERWPRLIPGLVNRGAVGVVIAETQSRGPVAVGATGLLPAPRRHGGGRGPAEAVRRPCPRRPPARRRAGERRRPHGDLFGRRRRTGPRLRGAGRLARRDRRPAE